MRSWQLQDAKSRFSEVVKLAEAGEVQVVTKHGKEVAVVLEYRRFLELTATAQTVWQSLRGAPDLSELTPERSQELIQTRDLG